MSRPRRRRPARRVRLSYSNAISVMPETSRLTIFVNDIQVAQTPIAAASDPGGVDVELPKGLLTAGYNRVRIAVSQRHRVDCSLEATYELWTQLDPAASGSDLPRTRRRRHQYARRPRRNFARCVGSRRDPRGSARGLGPGGDRPRSAGCPGRDDASRDRPRPMSRSSTRSTSGRAFGSSRACAPNSRRTALANSFATGTGRACAVAKSPAERWSSLPATTPARR